jgi:energy-coupling factor transport system substrate-specific component
VRHSETEGGQIVPESSDRSAETAVETLDELAVDLQRLRASAGHVAYGEIAARIARRREEQGLSHAAAQVGRSSVYDVFRAGRTRTNPDLVAEIVLALGSSDDESDRWRARCLRARSAQSAALPRKSRIAVEAATPSTVRTAMVVLLLLSCVGLNIFGNSAAGRIPVTLYLDMIGTAIAAIVLGPWYGVAVGAATSSLAAISNVPGSIAFIFVEIAGALVWGYGVRA